MRDLYATLFYKIKFTIEAKEPGTDLLWIIISHIKGWLTNKHNKKEDVLTTDVHAWSLLKKGGIIQGKNLKIVSENCYVEEPFRTSYWACKIIEPTKVKTGCAPRRWITEIGFEPLSPGKATFSCIISYSDRPGFIGEYEAIPFPNIPNIIKNIWNDTDIICRDGIDKPTSVPTKLVPGDWVDFWERTKNAERSLPYIYISPLNVPDDNGNTLLLDPEQLAIATGGNAKVYYAVNSGVTDEMNYFCSDDFKCYDGAIRVYHPQLNENDPHNSNKHRFLSSSYIRKVGSDHIIDIFRRAIAQDANFYDSFFRIEDCKAMREGIIRKRRLEELKQKHSEELHDTENSVLELAEAAEEKQLEAEDRAAALEAELKSVQEENYKLRAENESYYSLAKENSDLRKSANNRLVIKEYPQTAYDILRYFEAAFAEKIAFSDNAYSSLKDCTIQLAVLWKVFFALATIMTDLYIDGSGDIYSEFRRKSGIDVSRGEGTMTRKNKAFMKQYSTDYHGEAVNIEPHITYPALGQSIHFGFHQKDQKVVVGWCGKHLDNHSTRNVH